MDGEALSQPSADARLEKLEAEFSQLRNKLGEGGQEDRLSLIVFSGSLDRLIAAFVLATGAAAMGMKVSMFFTFWGTAALRRNAGHLHKSLLERMFGWMLPKGVKKLPLSQMNMGGGGPLMIRYVMKKKGVASVEEMMTLAAELGVEVNVCTMSMDLLGMKEPEMLEYPGLSYCGVAKFLENGRARQDHDVRMSTMQTLDARGKSCPLPIVLTAKAVKLMPVGAELTVLADDRAFLPDIEAWCRKTGHELRGTQSKDGFFEATIRRTA